MLDDKAFKDTATRIILDNFGVATAKLYEANFASKSKEEITASLEKLLVEFVGRENASKQINRLFET